MYTFRASKSSAKFLHWVFYWFFILSLKFPSAIIKQEAREAGFSLKQEKESLRKHPRFIT